MENRDFIPRKVLLTSCWLFTPDIFYIEKIVVFVTCHLSNKPIAFVDLPCNKSFACGAENCFSVRSIIGSPIYADFISIENFHFSCTIDRRLHAVRKQLIVDVFQYFLPYSIFVFTVHIIVMVILRKNAYDAFFDL